MAIPDFLIMPIQRIARYVLLLQDLRKHTPASHPDHALLSRAVDSMRALANAVNEVKRREEAMTRLFQVQKTVAECPPTIISATRQVVLETEVTEAGGKARPFRLILLTDAVLLAKGAAAKSGFGSIMSAGKRATAWKFVGLYPVLEVSVVDDTSTDGN